jgi:hypothetical protein
VFPFCWCWKESLSNTINARLFFNRSRDNVFTANAENWNLTSLSHLFPFRHRTATFTFRCNRVVRVNVGSCRTRKVHSTECLPRTRILKCASNWLKNFVFKRRCVTEESQSANSRGKLVCSLRECSFHLLGPHWSFLFCSVSGPAHVLCLTVASEWNKERCISETENILTWTERSSIFADLSYSLSSLTIATCLLVSWCSSVGPSIFIVLIFLPNLVLIVLMNTCVKFSFNHVRFTTTSVLIIQLSSIQYERKYALRVRSARPRRMHPHPPLSGSISTAWWPFCTAVCACCCLLMFTCRNWRDESTKCACIIITTNTVIIIIIIIIITYLLLNGLSLRANYTGRATAACRRSDCQLLRMEGATWSAWRIPTAVFSVFYTGAATFLSKSSSVVLTRLSGPQHCFRFPCRVSNPGLLICSQELWPLNHKGGLIIIIIIIKGNQPSLRRSPACNIQPDLSCACRSFGFCIVPYRARSGSASVSRRLTLGRLFSLRDVSLL